MEQEKIQRVALEFLKKNVTAVVSTCSKDQPEAATVFYVMDDDLNFYFVTRRSSRKFKNLSLNNKVAIVVGIDAHNPTTIQMEGEASYSVNIPAIAKLFEVVWKEKKLNSTLLYLKEDCEQYHEIVLRS